MLESTHYNLKIIAVEKSERLDGTPQSDMDFYVTLQWDARRVLDAVAYSPDQLGRLLGEAVRGMAEETERKFNR